MPEYLGLRPPSSGMGDVHAYDDPPPSYLGMKPPDAPQAVGMGDVRAYDEPPMGDYPLPAKQGTYLGLKPPTAPRGAVSARAQANIAAGLGAEKMPPTEPQEGFGAIQKRQFTQAIQPAVDFVTGKTFGQPELTPGEHELNAAMAIPQAAFSPAAAATEYAASRISGNPEIGRALAPLGSLAAQFAVPAVASRFIRRPAAPTPEISPRMPQEARSPVEPGPTTPKTEPPSEPPPLVVREGGASNPGAFTKKEGHAYRGMTSAEYDATVGSGRGIASRGDYSHPSEGTSFADDPMTAEDYVNFGRDDPRKTGRPTYLVETPAAGLARNRQGYFNAREPQQPTRVWRMEADDAGRIVAKELPVRPEPPGQINAEGTWEPRGIEAHREALGQQLAQDKETFGPVLRQRERRAGGGVPPEGMPERRVAERRAQDPRMSPGAMIAKEQWAKEHPDMPDEWSVTALRLKDGRVITEPQGRDINHGELFDQSGVAIEDVESGGWVGKDGYSTNEWGDFTKGLRSGVAVTAAGLAREGGAGPGQRPQPQRAKRGARQVEEPLPEYTGPEPEFQADEPIFKRPEEMEEGVTPEMLAQLDQEVAKGQPKPPEGRIRARDWTKEQPEKPLAFQPIEGVPGRQGKVSKKYPFKSTEAERATVRGDFGAEADKNLPFSDKMGLVIKRLTSQGKTEPPAGAQQFFDEKLAKKNKLGIFSPARWSNRRNMNQTDVAAPQIAQQGRKTAGASAAANYQVAKAFDRIGTEVGPEWEQRFTDTMSESQQRGQIRKYGDLRDEFAAADPMDVPDLYKDHGYQALVDINNVRPTGGVEAATNLYNSFDSAKTDMTKSKAAAKLKDLLVRTFDDSASNVRAIIPDEEFRANQAAPQFKKALGIAQEEFLNDLQDSHARNEGKTLRPEYLGPVGQYWPMTGKVASETAARQLGGGTRGVFAKPRNPLNKVRTGLSDEYDTSWQAVARKVGAAFRADEHASLITQAEQAGLVRKLPSDFKGPTDTYDWNGRTYVGDVRDGYAMPQWFGDELGAILERQKRSVEPGGTGGILGRSIVSANTAALVDKTFHYINAVGVNAAFNPALGGAAERALSYVPGFKTANAFRRLFREVKPEEGQAVREMLHNGEWYPRFDRESGELTAMSKRDLAVRLDMRKGILQENPNATPAQLYDAASRFGEYNRLLAPNAIRMMKGTTVGDVISPFITAGTTMRGNALQTLRMGLGTTGGVKAAAQGGLVMGLGSWVGAHLLVTGKAPDPSDPDFKMFSVPLGHTTDGRTIFLNTGRLAAPMANRGAGVTGLKNFLETLSRSQTDEDGTVTPTALGQAVNAAEAAVANAAIRPLAGPVPRFMTRAAFGVDPDLDIRGGKVSLRSAHEPTMPGPESWRANWQSAEESIPAVSMGKRLFGGPGGEEPPWYAPKPIIPLWKDETTPDQPIHIDALRALGIISIENVQGHAGALQGEIRDIRQQQRSYKRSQLRKEQ